MMTLSESQLQRKTINEFLLSGWLVLRVNGGALAGYIPSYVLYPARTGNASKGLSDLIVFKDGKAAFIELKTATKLRAEQKNFRTCCEFYNMKYRIINNINEMKEVCTELNGI